MDGTAYKPSKLERWLDQTEKELAILRAVSQVLITQGHKNQLEHRIQAGQVE